MKKLHVSALLIAGAIPSSMSAQNQNATFASLKHIARPILIFGSAGDSRVAEQLQDLVPNAQALRERDIRIIQIPGLTTGTEGNQLPHVTLPEAEQQQLRKRFNVLEGAFMVILVGKDGGEKLRSEKPLPWQTFEKTIDSMPMRRDEVKPR